MAWIDSIYRAKARALAVEVAVVMVGAALLLGVVVANGRPVVFADTNIYIWMGRLQLRPVRYALAPVLGGPASQAHDPEAADEKPADLSLRRTEMGARSPWFGLLLYAVTAWGGLWAFATMQSLVASYAIRALWRAAGGRPLEHLAVMAVLAVGTTLPFFAGFAMPDMWVGVGCVALATLLFLPKTVGRVQAAALFALSIAAVSFHHSNAVVVGLAASTTLLLAGLLWKLPWRRIGAGAGLLIVVLAVATALEGGYGLAIKAATGESLRSPPFLAARILADGPGRKFLRRSCAQGVRWALCRFRDLPLNDSQDILWSGDPSKGVFGRAGVAERIRIDREQVGFVLAVVASDPVGSVESALLNVWKTLTTVNLEDPLRDPHFYLTDPDWSDTFIADLVHEMSDCDPDERGCRPRFDPKPLALWHGGVCLAAVAALAAAASWKRTRGPFLNPGIGPIIVFFILAVLINAAVLGVVSGPFARYQARIAWLLPLAALLAAATGLRRRSSATRTGPLGNRPTSNGPRLTPRPD